jgi:adenylate cyclase
MLNRNTKTIVDWLVDGARSTIDTREALGELCDRLLDCGIPIWRVGLFVLTLDPLVMGQRFLWKPGEAVDVNSAPFEAFLSDEFRDSPVRHVIETGDALRRRLADKGCPIDFTTLRELREQGATDYLAVPLFFADGVVHGATFATQEPGGFTDAQIGDLESVFAPLSRVVENRTLRRAATTLLDTYVGNHGGSRILAGQIRRGDAETIDAAIWLSDMRGFTALADRMSPQTLFDLLNRYFDCQVPAIHRRGGEVLKFMGDGLLAIFPIAPDGGNAREVCNAALAAAREARAAVASSFGASEEQGLHIVRFGLALHLGQVLYGNIGSGNRLDFTCIGPAVNLAARIEKLTGKLERTILASDDFARQCASEFVPVGEFDLAGFATVRAVFGLEDEAGPGSTAPHFATSMVG